MRTKNGKYTGVVGEVLEFEPPHKYSHTFKFTNYDDPPCRVAYELKEVAGGVEFSLIIDGMPKGTKTEKQMKQGGAMIVKTLKAIVETGKPPLFVRMLYVLFRVLEPLSPKRTRSENWPL
ncbi:MAG: SRPBCC domain-containing protein [Planctomycetia bacterium]|nr:SRPBCC domain-containing protein [Planctomycetia bacterium]